MGFICQCRQRRSNARIETPSEGLHPFLLSRLQMNCKSRCGAAPEAKGHLTRHLESISSHYHHPRPSDLPAGAGSQEQILAWVSPE